MRPLAGNHARRRGGSGLASGSSRELQQPCGEGSHAPPHGRRQGQAEHCAFAPCRRPPARLPAHAPLAAGAPALVLLLLCRSRAHQDREEGLQVWSLGGGPSLATYT